MGWDLMGMMEPIKADWKIAMKALNGMAWSEAIPPEAVDPWKNRIRDYMDIQKIRWRRCIIPVDAVDPLRLRIICTCDGAEQIAAAAIYGGVLRQNGEYSVTLLLGRSRLSAQTIPRNEVDACVLGTAGTECVLRALGDKVTEPPLYITDSTIAYCWISNPNKTLMTFVFNRVKEVSRWTTPDQWRHVAGEVNPADAPTRPGKTPADLNHHWFDGYDWMKKATVEEMTPLTDYCTLAPRLTSETMDSMSKEEWALPDLQLIINYTDLDQGDLLRQMRLHTEVHTRSDYFSTNAAQLLSVTNMSGIGEARSSRYGVGGPGSCDDDSAVAAVMDQASGDATCMVATVGETTLDSWKVPEDREDAYACLCQGPDVDCPMEQFEGSQAHFESIHCREDTPTILVGVVKSKRLKDIVDPVKHGWRSTMLITKIVYNFIDTMKHRAHRRDKCRCLTPCDGRCNLARAELAKSCAICVGVTDWKQDKLVKEWAEEDTPAEDPGEVFDTMSMSQTIHEETREVEPSLSSIYITRLQAQKQKENAKVIPENIFGHRKKKCLCRPRCLQRGCLQWHVAKINSCISVVAVSRALTYWARKASIEVRKALSPTELRSYEDRDGILIYRSRIPNGEVRMRDLNLKFFAGQNLGFEAPAVLSSSPIGYSIAMYAHWELAPHCGTPFVLFRCKKFFHILGGAKLMKRIRKDCMRCRSLNLRTQCVEMGKVSPLQITLAPAFYACQIDIAGPFYALVGRAKTKVWAVVFVCLATKATSIVTMENYSTLAFLKAVQRHSSRYGYPLFMMPDRGSQLVRGCNEARFSFKDLQQAVHTEQKFEVRLSAVKNHEEHGLVERKIRSMKRILAKLSDLHTMSVLDWR